MGRVTVDGEIITEQGKQINPQVNKIALDGQKLKMERKRSYVFNKPPGVLCTNKDPQGRTRVIDFFPKEGPRVFSVGRLDEDSEGLLIVTNDGDLAQKLAGSSAPTTFWSQDTLNRKPCPSFARESTSKRVASASRESSR